MRTPISWTLLALVLVGMGAAISLGILDPDLYEAAKAFLPLP